MGTRGTRETRLVPPLVPLFFSLLSASYLERAQEAQVNKEIETKKRGATKSTGYARDATPEKNIQRNGENLCLVPSPYCRICDPETKR